MPVTVEGATAAGERFEVERELERVPGIGEAVEYEGERYVVEARSEEITGGEITGGSCRLKPIGIAIDPSRCPKTGFYLSRMTQCILEPNHLGVCQFR